MKKAFNIMIEVAKAIIIFFLLYILLSTLT